MTKDEVLAELKALGNEQTKKIWMNHGAPEPFFGVKVGDMKPIQKRIKKNNPLAIELYRSGNSDAMYLAGLIAEGSKMTKEELQHWADNGTWYMISEFTVPWVTSESPFALELAKDWINSGNDKLTATGWATYSSYIAITDNSELNYDEIKAFINHIEERIHNQGERVKYTMNNFIIAAGTYIPELYEFALETSRKIGKVTVNMGNTACSVPFAPDYLEKNKATGRGGKKRKTAAC